MDYDAHQNDRTLVDPNSKNDFNFDNLVVSSLVNVLLGLVNELKFQTPESFALQIIPKLYTRPQQKIC